MTIAFRLELGRAECEFLTGQSVAAEERLAGLSARAANTVELATVACLRVDVHTTLDQSDRAVDVCLDYLRHLGVEWSAASDRRGSGTRNTSGSGRTWGTTRSSSSSSCP